MPPTPYREIGPTKLTKKHTFTFFLICWSGSRPKMLNLLCPAQENTPGHFWKFMFLFSDIFGTFPRNMPKTIRKRSQSVPKLIPTWPRNDEKVTPTWSKSDPPKRIIPNKNDFGGRRHFWRFFRVPQKVIIGTKWVHINPHGPILAKFGAKYTHEDF